MGEIRQLLLKHSRGFIKSRISSYRRIHTCILQQTSEAKLQIHVQNYHQYITCIRKDFVYIPDPLVTEVRILTYK